MFRKVTILAALLASSCGGGLTLAELRCSDPCEDAIDPRLLLLQVDVSDPRGLGATTVFDVTLDGRALSTIEVVAPEHAGRPSATLPLAVQLAPGEKAGHPVADGEEFVVGTRARDGDDRTNEVSVRLRLRR